MVIAARKMDQLCAVQSEIQKLGGACDMMHVNIRDPGMATKLVHDIVEKHGRLDGLVVSPISGACFSSI